MLKWKRITFAKRGIRFIEGKCVSLANKMYGFLIIAFFRHFLKHALSRAYDFRKAYYLYSQQGADCDENCGDIVLFWRIQQVIKVTANALRQQIINREARRLDKEIKMVLDEISDDDDRKVQLLVGKRVTLAEELSTICEKKIISISFFKYHFFFLNQFV